MRCSSSSLILASPESTRSDSDGALTRRIRFMASGMIGVFLCSWVSWFAPFDDWLDRNGTPWGADFAMFYLSGRMVAEGKADQLYDLAAQQTTLQQLFPGLAADFALPYRYPPWVAIVASSVARLPYPAAYAIFASVSWLGWLIGCRWLLRRWSGVGGVSAGLALLALAGWPVALEALIGGQASLIACLLLIASIELFRGGRPELAGMVLAILTYKPNLLCLVLLGLTIVRPRLLAGWLPTVVLIWAGATWYLGPETLRDYVRLSQELALQPWSLETPPAKVHGWAAALVPIWGSPMRAGVLGIGVLLALAVGLRHRWDERRGINRFGETVALLLAINAGCNLYTPIYDLTLLGISVILFLQSFPRASQGQVAMPARLIYVALAAGYFGPHLSQSLSGLIGWQISLIILTAWTAWLFYQRWSTPAPKLIRDCGQVE